LDSHFASSLFGINSSAAERLGATTMAVTVKLTYIIAPFLAKHTSNRERRSCCSLEAMLACLLDWENITIFSRGAVPIIFSPRIAGGSKLMGELHK